MRRSHYWISMACAGTLSTGLLSACATVQEPAATTSENTKAQNPTGKTVVTGQATYRERIALEPGSELTVVLLDSSFADPLANLFAGTNVKIEDQQVPIPFSLTIDHSRLIPGDQYEVRGIIRGPGGDIRWGNEQGKPVDLSQEKQDLGTIILIAAE